MSKRCSNFLITVLVAVIYPLFAHAQAGGDTSLEEMAKKSNNPLSDVWLLIIENDTALLRGDSVPGTEVLNATLIEPVMPVPVFDEKWNLIFRPIIPILSVPIRDDAGKLFNRSPAEIAGSPRSSYGMVKRSTSIVSSCLPETIGSPRCERRTMG